MALDPSIALSYQPPQVNVPAPQPLQQFGQILSLRDMMAQGQLRGMQMQNLQSEMQDRQYKLKRVQDFQNLMQTNPDASPSDVYGVLGPDGTKVVQEMLANRKSDIENTNAHLGRLNDAAFVVLNSPGGPNNLIYQYKIKQLMDNKDLDPAMGNELLKHDVTDPNVQAQLQAFTTNVDAAKKQQDFSFAQADNAHKLVSAAAAAGEAQGKQLAQGLQNFASGIGMVTDDKGWADYLAKAPADVQKYYSGYKWGPDTAAVVQIAGSGKPEPGKTMPYPAAVTTQMAEIEQAKEQAKAAVEMQKYQPVIQSVLNGDQRFQDLPADLQSKIAPGLIMAKFQGFGKLLSDAERERLGDYDRAGTVLDQTLDKINGNVQRVDKTTGKLVDTTDKNIDLMGPGEGLKALSPWATDHRALQSDLITQQQQLKKFITNGSLRGLNADTLDKIFPTITTDPDLARTQIQHLKDLVGAEKQQYLRDLGDKVVPQGVKAPAAPAATGTPQASGGAALTPAQRAVLPTATPPPGKMAGIKSDGKGGWKGVFFNSKDVDEARRQGVIVP